LNPATSSPVNIRFQQQIGWALLVVGTLAILIATLSPFTFDLHHTNRLALLPSSFLDLPRNVLLFVPFGVGLSCVANARTASIVGISFGVTAIVEALQFFLPHRVPNLSDVAANTFGGYVGALCFRLWQRRDWCLSQLGRTWRPAQVITVWATYFALAIVLVAVLLSGLRPSGWDDKFRLALGNELTGDRPWSGSLRDVALFDRPVNADQARELLGGAIPKALQDSVLVSYPLVESYEPAVGVASRLVRAGMEPSAPGTNGAELIPKGWLVTSEAVTAITQRINSTREFTLALTATPAILDQRGPARIFTISRHPYSRNLTLSQTRDALALRWRSNWTGTNGVTPELQFPDVFVSLEPVRAVLSFSANTVSLYTSRSAATSSIFLGPELGAAAILREGKWWQARVGSARLLVSSMALPIMIYVPLGIASGFVAISGIGAQIWSVLSVVCPPLLYELAVVRWGEVSFRWPFFALGMFLIAASLLFVRSVRYFLLRRQ
jgi:VanZ like protein